MTEIEEYIETLASYDFYRIVFSVKANRAGEYEKAVLRRTADNTVQTERFTAKQAFHQNDSINDLPQVIASLFPGEFMQLEAFTPDHIYGARVTKNGRLLVNRRRNAAPEQPKAMGNDRQKKYLLDADHLPPVFEEIGIMTHDGKIRREMFDKYKQICRFTELIDDVLSHDNRKELRIVDFGCGKSYLTFVLYYYITEILHKKAHITGIDLKNDVIAKCDALAKKYRYDGLRFLCMDVKDYPASEQVDMVIALHACDVATDYALHFAVKADAAYIFSVPCCHKEARRQINGGTLDALTDYGVVCDKLSTIVTDTLRAKLLEEQGYRTEIVEFVDMENTPKNMLIRAVRHRGADRYRRRKAREQINRLKEQFGLHLTLEKLFETDPPSARLPVLPDCIDQ